MLKYCKQDNEIVFNNMKNKQIDSIAMSNTNFVDSIILSMYDKGVLSCLDETFIDKRNTNTTLPLNLIMTLSIASKMKVKTSTTDIPYAIQDHRTLAKLGYNTSNKEKGLFTEGTIRFLINKYSLEDLIEYYNRTVQNNILPRLGIEPNIHILDCTKLAVNFENSNYEKSTIAYDREGNKMRGYKLASIRGLYGDTGIIEDVRFGTASTHDLKLSEDMLRTTPCFHDEDILIIDRGFLSREMLNHLKNERIVDTYIPLRKNMDIYEMAVAIATSEDDWKPHPTRNDQMISHVNNLGEFWESSNINDDVDLNSCVVWYEKTQSYSVFVTTDMTKTAKDIVMTYQLRPEIEEDYRQLKDFWKLEDFKSTKLNAITFHIVCVLFGYLFYQIYLTTESGEEYANKSLPVIIKNYQSQSLNHFVVYSGENFAIMSVAEFIEFTSSCEEEVRHLIIEILGEK